MTFGFLIPTFVTDERSLSVFYQCLVRLQEFHPTVPKLLFVDSTKSIDLLQFDFVSKDRTIQIISTRYCDGEMNVLKHFYETKYFDVGILLHDSFLLKQPLTNIENISDVNFIWYFTNHRVHWHIIEEPISDYNAQHKIRTHDDLILHLAKRSYEGSDFYTWLQEIYWQKEKWIGCFGPVTILRHDFLRTLQEKTGFLQCIPHLKDKRDRMCMETLYALACQYVLGRPADSYDGLYYDGIHPNNNWETDKFKKIILYR